MNRAASHAAPSALRAYAGRWVAWDREQKRIVASGRSFGECRCAAASVGQFAVILAHVAPAGDPSRPPHYLEQVAVFISARR